MCRDAISINSTDKSTNFTPNKRNECLLKLTFGYTQDNGTTVRPARFTCIDARLFLVVNSSKVTIICLSGMMQLPWRSSVPSRQLEWSDYIWLSDMMQLPWRSSVPSWQLKWSNYICSSGMMHWQWRSFVPSREVEWSDYICSSGTMQ